MEPRKIYQRYVLQLSSAVALGLAVIIAVNVFVDPYKVFRLVNIRVLDDKKSKLNSRIAKGEAFMREDFQILLLGDSRTVRGLDPEHTSWGNKRVYNCAFPGGSLNEMLPILKLAVSHKRETLERIVVGVLPEFAEEPTGDVPLQFQLSRFNPETRLVYYYTDHLLSRNTFRVSLSTLLDALTVPSSIAYSRSGHRTHESQAYELNDVDWQRKFTRYAKITLGTPIRHGNRVPQAMKDALQHAIQLCQRNDIQLTFVFFPTHATLMEIMHARGKWPLVEDSKRILTSLASAENSRNPNCPPCEVWDFFDYDFYSTERVDALVVGTGEARFQGPLEWFWEHSHCKAALGNLIIDRIQRQYNSGLPKIGRLLTPDSIEPTLAMVREHRRRYRASESDNAAWIDSMAARYGVKHH